MATIQTAIRKLYKEAQNGDFFVSVDKSAIEVIREGGKTENLIEKDIDNDKTFWSFCKTEFNEKESVRMVFAIRQANKKVYNVEKITGIIKELESVLTFMDKCVTTNSDGFIYLDAIKIL
jgi:hypothetical protein